MGEFRMPSLGADMTEGTLLEWLVQPGAAVHRGDVVAVVDTAKAAVEVEVFEDGVVDALLVEPGTKVAVGAPLARLVPAGKQPALAEPPVAAAAAPVPAPRVAVAAAPAVASPVVRHLAHTLDVDLATVHGTGPKGTVTREDVQRSARPAARAPGRRGLRASPLARRRAEELGVDLAAVVGTGPAGAVTLGDVERSAVPEQAAPQAPRPAPEAPAARRDRSAAMREAIGALMARSKREIPHYYLTATVDMGPATAWLRERNAGRDVSARLLPAALLLKASALACRAVPEVNGWWTDGRFVPSEQVHLGVAVALRPSGLIAPALLDADALDLDTLMTRLRDLVARARAGTLRASELSAPTLTVTNLGDQGVDAVHGVIYPPQVALVGFGRVAERPWAQDGLLGVRQTVTATLAADHRVSDGHRGGRYLAAVAALLSTPEEL